jgi:Ca2+-binding RTX toxin-like protein
MRGAGLCEGTGKTPKTVREAIDQGRQCENLLMPTVDTKGNIYVVGSTGSRDLPVTAGAFQRAFGGGKEDGLLAALGPDGSKSLYCTYLGGSGDDIIRSIAFGPKGEVYLVGSTSSEAFPVTPGALQRDYRGKGDAFLVKLVPDT